MTAHDAAHEKKRAVIEGVNELSGEHIPLLEKEGWMRGQKISRSHLSPRRRARSASAIARSINSGQTGEIIRPERVRRTDHYFMLRAIALALRARLRQRGRFAIFDLCRSHPSFSKRGMSLDSDSFTASQIAPTVNPAYDPHRLQKS